MQTIRESIVKVDVGQHGLGRRIDENTARIESDLSELRKEVRAYADVKAAQAAMDSRVAKIEGNLNKVTMVIVLAVLGAVLTLVLNK